MSIAIPEMDGVWPDCPGNRVDHAFINMEAIGLTHCFENAVYLLKYAV